MRAGRVLAELAAQDLELERRRRESEVRQHEGGLRAAQAGADRAQMVAFQAKAAEAQAMLSLAETQLQRARIEAPFGGIRRPELLAGNARLALRHAKQAGCVPVQDGWQQGQGRLFGEPLASVPFAVQWLTRTGKPQRSELPLG